MVVDLLLVSSIFFPKDAADLCSFVRKRGFRTNEQRSAASFGKNMNQQGAGFFFAQRSFETNPFPGTNVFREGDKGKKIQGGLHLMIITCMTFLGETIILCFVNL